MSFKDTWRPRIDGVDDADSSAVNEIAEAVINNENLINNAPNKYYNKESVNNLFANALKGSASGEVVALKDVSPLEHNLGVRVSSENLFDIEAEPDAVIASSYSYQGGKLTINADAGEQNDYPRLHYEIYNADLFDTYISVSAKWENVVNVDYAYINVVYVNPQREETQLVWFTHDSGISSKVSKIKIPKYEEGAYIYVMLAAYTPDTSVERTFTVFDVTINLGKEAKPYTPHISDLSAVKLLVSEANLLSLDKFSWSTNCTLSNGVVTQINADTNTSPTFKIAGNGYAELARSGVISKGRLALEFVCTEQTDNLYFGVHGNTTDTTLYFAGVNLRAGTYTFSCEITNATQGSISWRNMQIEGGGLSDYKPYKEPTEYAYGEEIKSIYPTTMIMTDTEGVLIECEYNKDANKVVKSLEDRISALEALIVSQ